MSDFVFHSFKEASKCYQDCKKSYASPFRRDMHEMKHLRYILII